jgi:hypothetical protein
MRLDLSIPRVSPRILLEDGRQDAYLFLGNP